MKIEEEFTSASVNPRSHCLASCKSGNFVVYASSLQLVLQSVPENEDEVGVIKNLSERRHNKPITVLKRIKAECSDEFVTGGVDSKIVLWKLNSQKLDFLSVLEGASGSIGAVCGSSNSGRKVIAAAWVSDSSSGLKTWWTDDSGKVLNSEIIDLDQKAFALCLDSVVMNSGLVLLAVGTSKRFVELYGEADDKKSFSRLVSVAGHTDWIHSIAFNDNLSNLLLASAGQDTFVRLWSIEQNSATFSEDNTGNQLEDELTSSKNVFEFEGTSMKIQSHAVMQGHDDWVHSTVWNHDGSVLLTASSDKTCIIWREVDKLWRDDVRLGIVGGQAAGFFSAVFSNDENTIVASSYFGGLHAWRAEDQEKTFWSAVTMTGGHVGEVRDVDWQTGADGKSHFLISVGEDQTTRIFGRFGQQNTFVEIGRPQVHGHDMQCLAMVNPSVFVSGAEEKIFRAFRAPKSFVSSLKTICGVDSEKAFGDSKLAEFGACVPALGLSNKSMAEGETVDGEHWEEDAFRAAPSVLKKPPTEDTLQQNTLWPEEHKLYGHGFEVYAVAVNPTGKVLATACKSSHVEHSVLILWSTDDWSKKAEIPGHQLTVTQIAWNPSGTTLLTVSRDRTAKLYKERSNNVDGFDYECKWTSAKQHSRIIWACDWFKDDDSLFVTAARDQKVVVWKVGEDSTAAPLATIKCSEPVTAVAASSGSIENSIIAAGLQSGEIIFLRLIDSELQQFATIGKNPIPIDASVLRLRFSRRSGCDHELAAATTDAKLRVFRVSV